MLLFISTTMCEKCIKEKVSIHLILLFIDTTVIDWVLSVVFQYISCYSLSATQTGQTYTIYRVSIHLMLLFIWKPSANGLLRSMFQYISCYSLSIIWNQLLDGLKTFQYISCYSLSKWCRCPGSCSLVSIHLMLLFIQDCIKKATRFHSFQYISCYSLSVNQCFQFKS